MSDTIATTRRGEIKKWSQTLIPTAREAPADAETPSHILLSRAGFIRRTGAGMYSYLPLAWRSLMKISQIVREEMEAAGASELLMPAVIPIELYKVTGRDEAYGELLFRVHDRHGRENALGPTHEEVITDIFQHAINSYKQLPLTVYQIQTKFRDEFRPRAGLLRCREFIMKDAYSFHLTVDGPGGLNETYDAQYAAYVRVFERLGLDFTVVDAESGPIGGSASHEFMVNAESGEDKILVCDSSGYAANVEKCEIGERAWSFEGEALGDLAKVHTPGMASIEDIGRFMKVKPANMLKTMVFDAGESLADEPSVAPGGGQRWVVAVVRGNHDVNESKVRDAIGGPVALADEKEARAAGFAIGYVGPAVAVGRDDVLLLVDPDAAQSTDSAKGKAMFWAAGANEADHHVKFFNWQRELGGLLDSSDQDASARRVDLPGASARRADLPGASARRADLPARIRVADIRNANAGDPSPRAEGSILREQRGIEVGHIFKLGCKYSDAVGFGVLDQDQQRQSVIMGCYGLGVSRTLAACVEMSHDENGIIFPAAIAPYHVLITLMKPDDPAQQEACARVSGELAEQGIDVLIDDREERPGVKFKDADLIGLPVRLTIGDKALAEGAVEFKPRRSAGKGELVPIDRVVARCADVLGD